MLGDTTIQPRKQISIPLQKSTSKPSEPHKENLRFIKKCLLLPWKHHCSEAKKRKRYGTRARAMRSSHSGVKELRIKPKPPILDTTLKASARPTRGKKSLVKAEKTHKEEGLKKPFDEKRHTHTKSKAQIFFFNNIKQSA